MSGRARIHVALMRQLRAHVEAHGGRVRPRHDVEFLACDCAATDNSLGVPARAVRMTSPPNSREERAVCSCGVVSLCQNRWMDSSILIGAEILREFCE